MNKEVTDIHSIKKLVDTLFKMSPVYLEVNGESIPIKYIEFKPEGILIRTPKSDSDTNERILTVTNKDNLFQCNCLEIGSDDFGNSILKPLKLQIQEISNLSNSDNTFSITNIVTPPDIFSALNDSRVSQIIKRAPKVNYMFDFFEVYISEKMTSRMRLIATHDKPIFIPNISNPEQVRPEFVPFKDYISLTKGSNFLDKYKAEICIPIKYKNFVLIGYAHAMHGNRLDYNSYNTFRLVASSVVRDIHTSGLFEETKEICPVMEIGKDFIRFLHPPTRQANRIFSMGAQIIFDLVAKGGNRKYVRGEIKGIKPTLKDFSITCDFSTVGREEQEAIIDFISKHS
jgi:hypothetical protein